METVKLSALQRLNLDSFRLFVPAYLLVYGASLITLPPGVLTQPSDTRLPIGIGATFVGMGMLWMATSVRRGPPRTLGYGLLVGLAVAGAALHLMTASYLSSAVALLIGFGLALVGASPVDPEPANGRRPDYLVHMMAIAVAVQGLAFLADVGTAGRLNDLTGIPPVPLGFVMIGSAGVVLWQNATGRGPQPLEWAAAIISGGSLLALQVVAAVLVEPLYWLLGISITLLAVGLMTAPYWRRRWVRVEWSSLRTRVAAALVTTATLSILGTATVGLYGRESEIQGIAAPMFAAIALWILIAYVLGWWWGGRLARSQRDLASAMGTLVLGQPWKPPPGERDTELELIAREVEMLADRLVEDRAAASHRAHVSLTVERALSSSLNIETALTHLLDALVPACDAAGAYVRREEGIVRLAMHGPQYLTAVSVYPLRRGAKMGPDAVMRTGRPEFYLDGIPHDYFENVASDDEYRLQFEGLDITSMMIVPIVGTEGAMDGAISVKMLGPSRRFTEYDVASLLDYASRAALAIENGRLYEEVAEASSAKDEFLGLVSHELRTPITTILGDAVLLRRERSVQEREELATDIEAEATRLAEIVENLLAIGRLGPTPMAHEPTRLEAAIAGSIAEARRVAPLREIVFTPRDKAIVESNETWIQVVMHNLLVNAVKYSDDRHPIEVELAIEGDRAYVSVLDRGPGFPAAEADRIFEPFYRSSNVKRKAGLGIGLTVCRRIIEALGGEINASSRPGGGTIFRFWLPLAEFEDLDLDAQEIETEKAPAGAALGS